MLHGVLSFKNYFHKSVLKINKQKQMEEFSYYLLLFSSSALFQCSYNKLLKNKNVFNGKYFQIYSNFKK